MLWLYSDFGCGLVIIEGRQKLQPFFKARRFRYSQTASTFPRLYILNLRESHSSFQHIVHSFLPPIVTARHEHSRSLRSDSILKLAFQNGFPICLNGQLVTSISSVPHCPLDTDHGTAFLTEPLLYIPWSTSISLFSLFLIVLGPRLLGCITPLYFYFWRALDRPVIVIKAAKGVSAEVEHAFLGVQHSFHHSQMRKRCKTYSLTYKSTQALDTH